MSVVHRFRQWLHADPVRLVVFQLAAVAVSSLNVLFFFFARGC